MISNFTLREHVYNISIIKFKNVKQKLQFKINIIKNN